jgi:hypothetical protein
MAWTLLPRSARGEGVRAVISTCRRRMTVTRGRHEIKAQRPDMIP